MCHMLDSLWFVSSRMENVNVGYKEICFKF